MSKLPDFIHIVWHIDDVKEIRDDLTEEECREVLQFIKNNHDSNVGVNWGTIEAAANFLFSDF